MSVQGEGLQEHVPNLQRHPDILMGMLSSSGKPEDAPLQFWYESSHQDSLQRQMYCLVLS